MKIKNIIFDFGGVLVDWNPRYLFKNIFNDDEKMEHFLANICTDSWNIQQDAGRTLADGTRILQEKFPEEYFQDFLRFHQITKKTFWNTVEKFRGNMWYNNNGLKKIENFI